MLIETVSTDAGRALPTEGSSSNTLSPDIVTQIAPPNGDGVLDVGRTGAAFNRLMIWPYCAAAAGSQFYLRLWGWRPTVSGKGTIWFPYGLLDLACVAGDIPGPPANPAGPFYDLSQKDNFCDGLQLVLGSVGYGSFAGDVVSYGPGSRVAAHCVVDLRGARKVQWDFAAIDDVSGMNALWARA